MNLVANEYWNSDLTGTRKRHINFASAVKPVVGSSGIYSPNIKAILVMPQSEYDALEEKSSTTLYLIMG